jgi:hypothetical protein
MRKKSRRGLFLSIGYLAGTQTQGEGRSEDEEMADRRAWKTASTLRVQMTRQTEDKDRSRQGQDVSGRG